MTVQEVLHIVDARVLPAAVELYGLEGYELRRIGAHEGGRNIAYACEKEGAGAKILRVAYLPDRTRADYLGEVEFIRYLASRGGPAADVVCSRKGNLLEEIGHEKRAYFACLFEKARGKRLVENHYRYREGAPISEYFYNCGKTLGQLHRLSKEYTPEHRRYDFFDKYNPAFIDELIPGSLPLLKKKLVELLDALAGLDRSRESYGMVHFDYNDGNYNIDFDTGQITVYDFDNSCFCWYLFDLASIWRTGVGWTQFQPDAGKRRQFMDEYFQTALAGYRSETAVSESMLELLPLFIQVNLMENVMDAFEVMRSGGEEPACDESLSYLIKCLEDDIPYVGLFDPIYSADAPFEYEERRI